MPSESVIRETLTNDSGRHCGEARRVRHLARIEAKRLLIQVSEQVKRFNRHVGALKGALQQRRVSATVS